MVARFFTGSAQMTFRKSLTFTFSRCTSSFGSISSGSSNSFCDISLAFTNWPRWSRDSGVSGRSSRASNKITAGTAPSARPTRHSTAWSMPAMYIRVMTRIAKTSPRPNMNCHRVPIFSRVPFDIDSMM